jgi:hypothetical protein
MKFNCLRSLIAAAIVSCLATSSVAQTLETYQGLPRPLNLSPIGPTYKSASHASSIAFANSLLPGFLGFIQSHLPEGKVFTGASLNQLDPTRLFFTSDYSPTVYFLSEGAGYNNALCVTIAQAALPTNKPVAGDHYIVFPLAQSPKGTVNTGPKLSQTQPLMPGDFVELGPVSAGSQLAFFLAAEMDSTTASATPKYVYYNGEATNPDNYQHMIAFFPNDGQFIIIAFEDMNSVTEPSDRDCNDVVFAVDIGPDNANTLRNISSFPR